MRQVYPFSPDWSGMRRSRHTRSKQQQQCKFFANGYAGSVEIRLRHIGIAPDSRWDDDELGELKSIAGSNFEAAVKLLHLFIFLAPRFLQNIFHYRWLFSSTRTINPKKKVAHGNSKSLRKVLFAFHRFPADKQDLCPMSRGVNLLLEYE